jgi:hypothetical protein
MSTYKLEPTEADGVLSFKRDDAPIGAFDEKKKELLLFRGCEKFEKPALHWLSKNNMNGVRVLVAGESESPFEAPDEESGGVPGSGVVDDGGASFLRARVAELEEEIAALRAECERLRKSPAVPVQATQSAPVVRGGRFVSHKHPKYPDGPDLDPVLGAKTPAFVEWLDGRGDK